MKRKENNMYPSAKAPDHWRRKPRRADMKMADELLIFHLNNNTPGGSNHGINANKKKTVTGVVFHINLHQKLFFFLYILLLFISHNMSLIA